MPTPTQDLLIRLTNPLRITSYSSICRRSQLSLLDELTLNLASWKAGLANLCVSFIFLEFFCSAFVDVDGIFGVTDSWLSIAWKHRKAQ